MGLKFVGQFKFISWHGKLLQSHTDGEMHASQDHDNVGDEERWNVHVWDDGRISLSNYRTNSWLCAEPSGRAICDRAKPASWEQWTLHTVGDGLNIALKSTHNKFLCAQPPGQNTDFGGEVIADRSVCQEWERFSMVQSAADKPANQSWWNDVSAAVNVAKEIAPLLIAVAGA